MKHPSITRRQFMKGSAVLSTLPFLPPGFLNLSSICSVPNHDHLFAIDFIWQCRDPFLENNMEYYLSENFTEWGGTPDIIEKDIDNSCHQTFLVRGLLQGTENEVPEGNREIESSSLRLQNPHGSFHCPICDSGWWTGHVAKGFQDTFYFTQLDGVYDDSNLTISEITFLPHPGTLMVRKGREEWFQKMDISPGPSDPSEDMVSLCLKRAEGGCTHQEFESKRRVLEQQAGIYEKSSLYWEGHLRAKWAECNATLPNKKYFAF